MQLALVDIEYKHSGNTIYHDTWRIPEYTIGEWNALREAWRQEVGGELVNLYYNGATTPYYDWLSRNTLTFEMKVNYYNPAAYGEVYEDQLDRILNIYKEYFPCFKEDKNLFDILDAETPDSTSTYYKHYILDVYSDGVSLGTMSADIPYRFYIPQHYSGCIPVPGIYFTVGYGSIAVDSDLFVRIVDGANVYCCRQGSLVECVQFPYAFPAFPELSPETYGVMWWDIDSANIGPAQKAILGATNTYDPVDPYSNGGNSSENIGGNTNFDTSSDTIMDSSLPSISAANTGFTRIYNPTLTQVQNLANYLWTDPSIISTLWNHVKQFLENPMDAFIAFNLVPCTVPDGGTTEFKVMYIGTGVQITVAGNQFVDVDCGSVQIEKMYDSALDYSPYTRVSMFLPYIGSVELNCDEVMGKTLSVKYRIDIVSGGCVAKIFVDGSVRYQYSGHCAITIPFTSADFTGYVSAMIQAGKMVASLAAGAAGMSELAATIAGVPGQKSGEEVTTTKRELNPATGRLRQTEKTTRESSGTKASFTSLVKSGLANTASAVIGAKPVVERSGSFSGNTGYLGVRRPYVIIERPNMCNPEQYGKYNGRPSMIYANLGSLVGYTVVQEVQLTGFTATNPELDEIGSFLKGGVIL